MSSQLNFFTVLDDWPNFIEFFHKHSIKMIDFKTSNPDVKLLDEISFENGRLPFKIGLTLSEFASDISYIYCEPNNKYELDTEKSLIVEFDTGGFYASSSEKLHRARFYAVNDYYARRGEHVTKPQDFKKWTQSFYKAFKKAFLEKIDDNKVGITFTQASLKWMKDNNAKIDGGYISLSINK